MIASPKEKAEYLANGGTLDRVHLIDDWKKVDAHLRTMRANCSKVINQFKKW